MTIIGKGYTWGDRFWIHFDDDLRLTTYWGNGYYRWLNEYTIEVTWGGYFHILSFNPDYTKYASIRLWDLIYGDGSIIGEPDSIISAPMVPLNLSNQESCKILTVILSCQKHSYLWKDITKRLFRDTIILCGGADETRLEDNVLYLKCNDAYDGLSEKIMCAYDFIMKSDMFKSVTHILKSDDNNTYFTVDEVENIIKMHNEELKTQNYIGRDMVPGDFDRTWHYEKVPITSKWYYRPELNYYVPYLCGGSTYILSKTALTYLVACKDEYTKFLYEDLMIGTILKRYNITPYIMKYNIKSICD